MTNQQKTQEAEAERKETIFLDEAFRLSEQMITEHNNAFATIERKAVLLLTLYFATIAYILSLLKDIDNSTVTAILPIIIIVLVVAIYIGSFALYTREFWGLGVKPNYALNKDFDRNCNKMRADLLKRYQKRYDTNREVLSKKAFYLKLSFWVGIIGTTIGGLVIYIKIICLC